jgi:hypothetical protein
MSSVDRTQLPGLVTDAGYDVVMEAYTRKPFVYKELFQVIDTDGVEEGWTAKSVCSVTEPEETERGQNAPMRTANEVYQWYIKSRKLQEGFRIPEEMMRSSNASALITALVQEKMGGIAGGFAAKKEKMAADIFNRGSISAGDRNVFKGSYPGHANPNEGLIYDGKPFFAASGNGHPLGLKTATTLYNQDALALSLANLNAARTLHVKTNAYNEAGEFIGGNEPDVLVVPAELAAEADVLVRSTLKPGTAQNDSNFFQGRYRVVAWSYLTDTDGWFLGAAKMGLRAYDSGLPTIHISAPDEDNGNVTVRLCSYFGAGVTQWRDWTAHATSTS